MARLCTCGIHGGAATSLTAAHSTVQWLSAWRSRAVARSGSGSGSKLREVISCMISAVDSWTRTSTLARRSVVSPGWAPLRPISGTRNNGTRDLGLFAQTSVTPCHALDRRRFDSWSCAARAILHTRTRALAFGCWRAGCHLRSSTINRPTLNPCSPVSAALHLASTSADARIAFLLERLNLL
jgi:hypothetical protein